MIKFGAACRVPK